MTEDIRAAASFGKRHRRVHQTRAISDDDGMEDLMPRRGHRYRPYRLNGTELLKALRVAACRKQLGRCYWCGCILRTDVEPTHPQFCTADHLIPLHAGGRTQAGNIVAACRVCNNGRHPELNRTRAPRSLTIGEDRLSSPFEMLKQSGK